jgi:hypothetical protein
MQQFAHFASLRGKKKETCEERKEKNILFWKMWR